MNAEEKGSRKFILIQQPYDNERITRPRSSNICKSLLQRASEVIRVTTMSNGARREKGRRCSNQGSLAPFRMHDLGSPLSTTTATWAKSLPSFEELAKYIFYTETSRGADLKMVDEKTGYIGEFAMDHLLPALLANGPAIRRGLCPGLKRSIREGEEAEPGDLLRKDLGSSR